MLNEKLIPPQIIALLDTKMVAPQVCDLVSQPVRSVDVPRTADCCVLGPALRARMSLSLGRALPILLPEDVLRKAPVTMYGEIYTAGASAAEDGKAPQLQWLKVTVLPPEAGDDVELQAGGEIMRIGH